MSEYLNVNFHVMHMATTRGQQTPLTLNSIVLEKKRITLVVVNNNNNNDNNKHSYKAPHS